MMFKFDILLLLLLLLLLILFITKSNINILQYNSNKAKPNHSLVLWEMCSSNRSPFTEACCLLTAVCSYEFLSTC